MTKYEFIDELKKTLSGEIPQFEIDSNIKYYEDYFNNSAKSEEQVIKEIGDPRLIAKTIIESSKIKLSNSSSHDNTSYKYENHSNAGTTTDNREEGNRSDFASTIRKVFWIVVGIIVLLGIISIGGMILRFLFPIILVLLVVNLFMRRR